MALADPVVVVEHLRYLCQLHKQTNLARQLGVSQTYLSRILTEGKNHKPITPEFQKRLLEIYPLTPKQIEAGAQPIRPVSKAPKDPPVEGPTGLQEIDLDACETEEEWLNHQRRIGIEALGRAEQAQESLADFEWLLLRPEYQLIRTTLLAVAPALHLGEVLLPPPEDGPCRIVAEARAVLASIEQASKDREGRLDTSEDTRGKIALAHTHLRAAVRRQLGKISRQAPIDDLLRSKAWGLTILSLSARLKADVDKRMACVAALRDLPSAATFSIPLADALDRVRGLTFPCTQYQQDPIGFIRRVIGREAWELDSTHWQTGEPCKTGQTVIAYSVRDHKWTVVHTGHKIGKTALIGWLCLWWYSVWDDGRVLLANFTGKQLETQDWFEVKKAHRESGVCLDCRNAGFETRNRPCPHSQIVDGECRETSAGGLTSPDGNRFVRGATAREATGVGGYSGAHLLVVIDEFSGMSQELYDGWISNTSSRGSRFLGVGNPIGQDGPMYNAVMVERYSRNFNVINISSEDAARTGIDGLADAGHIARVLEQDERGVDSPFYMIRVRGLYPTVDEQSIYAMRDILNAQVDDNYRETPAEGRLIVTLDPAKEEGTGDQNVAGATRGFKVLETEKGRGWKEDDALAVIVRLIRAHRSNSEEIALVGIDADGPGQKVIRRLDDYQQTTRIPESEKVRFELIPVYFGHEAIDRLEYEYIGDEAHRHLSAWLRHGGVFPVDRKLEQEMQISKWFPVRRRRDGRDVELLSATRKDGPNGYRKLIHRSPDTLDMLRVMAYVAYMRDVMPAEVPPEKSAEAKADQENVDDVPAVDEGAAFMQYMDAIRNGRMC